MKLTNTQRGLLTLFGGFTVHLVIGVIFMWGTLNVYITSYFRQLNDQGLSLSIGGAIFPVMMISVATGMPLGIKAIQIFGSGRYYVLFASVMCSLLVFLSSYTDKFWQYVLVYGIIFGLFSGSIYFIPIYMGYLYFPMKKGFVAGTILTGYGLCSLVFGMTFFSFVNPDQLQQQKNEDGYSYFEGSSIQVAKNVPGTLRKMSLIYLIVSVFGSLFLMYHPNQIGEEERRLKRELLNKQKKEEKLMQELQDLSQQNLNLKKESSNDAQQLRKQSLIEKKIEVVKDNIEILEQQELLIEKQIELQKEEDKKQPFFAFEPKFNNTNQNELATNNYNHNHQNNNRSNTPSQTQDNQNLLVFQKPNATQTLQTEESDELYKVNDDQEQHNRKAHFNEYIDQIEVEINEIQKSLVNLKEENQARNQQLEDKQKQIEEYNKMGSPSAIDSFKQPQYYMSLLLGILAIGFPIIVNGNYKSIAKDYGFLDDTYQTIVGALVSIANGLSRPVWASLLDKFTFKQILTVILIIQILCTFTLQFSEVDKAFFAIWAFIINATFGGVLSMWPVFSAQLHGVKIGSKIYGTYWYGFAIANFIQFLFVYFLKPKIGFNNIFYIYTGISSLALILLSVYNFKIEWSKYYLKREEMKINQEMLKQNCEMIEIKQNK